MNIVEAVPTSQIETVSTLLVRFSSNQKQKTDLYADVWKLGINLALRISDLLSIQFSDIQVDRRRIILVEQKTKKRRELRLNDPAMAVIEKRMKANPDHTYLFQSTSNRTGKAVKPVSRSMVARKFKEVGETIGVDLSTHSMRKTRGKAMFDAGLPIERIAQVLNHSSTATTARYIGITQDQINQTYDDFCL